MQTLRRTRFFVSLLALLPMAAGLSCGATGWKLVWSDEFNRTAGSAPDPAKWNYDLGGGGWGNGEAEIYTDSVRNVFEDGKGNLVIRALRDDAGAFTSARLQTGGPGASTHTADVSWQYGRIVARIKAPFGQGVWPAFWMLGENIGTVGWPNSGEIDIEETFGTFLDNGVINNGAAHGPGYSGGSGLGKSYTLPFGEKLADDYHVYAIDWSQDSIEWSVDGFCFYKITPASLPAGRQWVFNNSFFILLNLAIGGSSTFLGTPDPSAPFPPQDMLVDYVRVYQATDVSSNTPVITPGQIINAASGLGATAPGSLAALYGLNLADMELSISGLGGFPDSIAGLTVTVNGVNAPLLYVSPAQINFQIPWETVAGSAVEIKVSRNGLDSNIELVTVEDSAPSVFLSEFTNGVAWVTGTGCVVTECRVSPGTIYQLWGNGFGLKNAPSPNGQPAPLTGSLALLEVPGGTSACELIIGGHAATVQYCGAAPGEIIDQLNFIYPAGVPSDVPWVPATLTIHGATGSFRVPAPLVGSNPVGQ